MRRLAIWIPLCLLALVVLSVLRLQPPLPGVEVAAVHSDEPPAIEENGPGVFDRFDAWRERYRSSSPENRSFLEKEGLSLAMVRREEMIRLISGDPTAALERSISLSEREKLPREIRMLVEEPFSIRAKLDVFPLCESSEPAEGHRSQGGRIALTDEKGAVLDAYATRGRGRPLSRKEAPVQGIRIDGLAALREDVFTRVPDREVGEARLRYALGPRGSSHDFLTGEPIAGSPIVALAGGELHFFADVAHLEQVNRAARRLEKNVGLRNGSALLLSDERSVAARPLDLEDIEDDSQQMASIWSTTTHTALLLLIDFSDVPGAPYVASEMQDLFDGTIHDQFAAMSYHKTGISATVHPTVFRMPELAAFYNGSTTNGIPKSFTLFNHAVTTAEANGVVTEGYDHVCIVFAQIGMMYSGLATVGGDSVWLPEHEPRTIVHELGHNFGLNHASWWNANTQVPYNPVHPDGTHNEYGDNTDIMGQGGVTDDHFHVEAKSRLGWLEPDQVVQVADSPSEQTVRIYRFDHEDTATLNRERAVRLSKGANEFYWIGYRQNLVQSQFAYYFRGIQMHWQRPSAEQSWMLDLTEGGGKNNAGLPIGRTYSDPVAGIHVTPLARGGAAPDEWIDVRVNVGSYPGNRPPEGTLNVPSSYPLNESLTYGATVVDPDGDELAYFFDVDTGEVLGEDATAESRTRTWTLAGSKLVTLTVSDMKGGTLNRTTTIEIVDPIPAPTGLSASDDAFPDRVHLSWTPTPGATGYAIFRGKIDSLVHAAPIGEVAGVAEYDDFLSFPGQGYFYRVQAIGEGSASVLSASDAGARQAVAPPAPGGFSASQNEFTDRVQLDWNDVVEASEYDVYRSESIVFGDASMIASVTHSEYSDTSALPGLPYHYWIRSRNPYGDALGGMASGSRKLAAPAGLDAEDGVRTDAVRVSWNGVGGAEFYRIYRSTEFGETGIEVGTSAALTFDDLPPTTVDSYWYTVVAHSPGSGDGEPSLQESGYLTFAAPASFTTILKRYRDRVRLEWSAVSQSGSIEYTIFRADAGEDFSEAVPMGVTTGLWFDDIHAEAGREYSYWLQAEELSGGVSSLVSAAITGMRAASPPFQPDLKAGATAKRMRGDDRYSQSGGGQVVSQALDRGRKLHFFLVLENDGLLNDDIRLVSKRKDRYFTPTLKERGGAGRNITAAASAGRYRLNGVGPSERQKYSYWLGASRKARERNISRAYYLRAISLTESRQVDLVKLKAKTKFPR